MTPVAGLQSRAREIGRLRLGVYEDGRPQKLTTWRLTSQNRDALDRAAELFGGVVEPWTSPSDGESFQITTDTAEIDVLVPPQDLATSQYLELWGATGCARRCTGVFELLTGGPCICVDEPGERQCDLVTHLLLLIPSLPDIGTWRLVTRGFHGAQELPATVDILNAAAGVGFAPAATLGIEARSRKTQGNVVHHFVVPVLRSRFTLNDLAARLEGSGGRLALPSESAAREDGPAVREQVALTTGADEGVAGSGRGHDPEANADATPADSALAAASGNESAELIEGSPPPVPPPSDAAGFLGSNSAAPAPVPGSATRDEQVGETGAESSNGDVEEGRELPLPTSAPAPDPRDDEPASAEQWNRATRVYGTRLQALAAAAQLTGRTVAEGNVTRGELAAVIEARVSAGAVR